MKNLLTVLIISSILGSCTPSGNTNKKSEWKISVLPSSVRLDPVTSENIESRFRGVKQKNPIKRKFLKKNWLYDGKRVNLYGARGEYISFQVVLTRGKKSELRDIDIKVNNFKNGAVQFDNPPELFLEWFVEVKQPSTGYPRSTLGKGWYPDALIPFRYIQTDSTKIRRFWRYPLRLPDFNNHVDDQRSLVVWVDQYIPFQRKKAKPGNYQSEVMVTVGNETKNIPVNLMVWDFAIPNENKLRASLQHEGFISRKSEKEELKLYQLFKRNRIGLMDPTYKPGLQMYGNRSFSLQWGAFDHRLNKYFNGTTFTKEYGYDYGPGYGEPIETFILPFNVYGKHGGAGWPDIGNPEVERNPENSRLYRQVIREIRNHLKTMIDPEKTELSVYLNGLDESYFPEAWDRMVYYGNMFKEEYPETRFRIDGSYSEDAMKVVQNSINSWASHTINYDIERIRKYQDMGIEDWVYGPMLYEARVNSWVGSSTFIDLPLVNDRAISWACWKYRTHSWLSWGVGAGWLRAWYDPQSWKDTHKQLNGNGMLIYAPDVVLNVNGPCPSIRLKTMRDGVQEYEYLRFLSKLDGNRDRADEIVNNLIKRPFGEKSIGNLDVWSYDPGQWDRKRIEMGELIQQAMKDR